MTKFADGDTCDEMQQKLDRVQEELATTRQEMWEVVTQYKQCKADLRREELLNSIAIEFIPDNQHGDYFSMCPHKQPLGWEVSSPAVVSILYLF